MRPKTNAEWLALDQEYRMNHRYTAPYVVERGEGVRFFDTEGRSFLDFESGQVCASTGHCHPKYVQAIKEAAGVLVQTSSAFTTPSQILLAERLAQLTGGRLRKSFFASTGSESNEAALRLAKLVTGRQEVGALLRGYHGMTFGAHSLSGFGGHFRQGYGPPMPGVTFLPEPYCYRCAFNEKYPGCRLSCFDFLEYTLERATSGRPAAIFMELVMSGGGMLVVPQEYVAAMRKLCSEREILLVFDEAQTAIGRTGTWFAFQHYGIEPDVVTVSKALGGGVPLSAVITTDAVSQAAEARDYYQSSSHTGDPFLCAVGLANIGIIEEEGLLRNAETMGNYIMECLREMADRYGVIGDVRGLGLMIGVEFMSRREDRSGGSKVASAVSQYCIGHGLQVSHRPGVLGDATIRLLPPLVISQAEADEALNIFQDGVKHAAAATPQ